MLEVVCNATAKRKGRCSDRITAKAQEAFAGLRARDCCRVQMAVPAIVSNSASLEPKRAAAAAHAKLAGSVGESALAAEARDSKDSEPIGSSEPLACSLPNARSVCESSGALRS